MSILATASQTPSPPEQSGAALLVMSIVVLAALAGLTIAIRVRAYQPKKVLGPSRLPPNQASWPLALALFAAILSLFVASSMAAAMFGATQESLNDPTNPITVAISIIGMVVSLVLSLGLLLAISPASVEAIGLRPRSFLAGCGLGVVGALVGVPWTMLVAQAVDWVYQAIQYVHPAEHDLLRTMKETTTIGRYSAILAAIVVAPLVEEYLFRGLLQTMIRSALNRLRAKATILPNPNTGLTAAYAGMLPPLPPDAANSSPAISSPVISNVPASAVTVAPLPLAVLPYEATAPVEYQPTPVAPIPSTPLAAWLSIVVTSALFAIVHPLWTAPIIFFLSLVLGYVYERTGNLWAAMVLHALFNLTSTVLYLASV